MYRTEKDSLGEKQIPSEALYGINALRAADNFPPNLPFPEEWYRAVGLTKKACYNSYRNFRHAAEEKLGHELPFRTVSDEIINALILASGEVAEGKHFNEFIVPAIQGGAGTSINMNINEIIANRALLITGHHCGEYDFIDPTEHANIYQSTNDVIPTALTVAVTGLLNRLEESINNLRIKVEELERSNRENLRLGYTEMQEAIPTSFGILFSTYNEALSRDWWRVSKGLERIKQVNLGGGATGTGLSLPRFYIMEAVAELRKLTGLPLSHSENLSDATINCDKWVELHATLKAHAVNLEKISSDIRLLSCDFGKKTIKIPEKQTGSSIMPGKINPVISEFVISAAHKVYANDLLVSSLSGQGMLDLNAYIPVIGYSIIESIKLLISCNTTMLTNLFTGMIVSTNGYKELIMSPSVTTALTPFIGYHEAGRLAEMMKKENIDIFSANSRLNMIDEDRLKKILLPGNLVKLGFSIDDL
jgi:aspartate ammonia-lyase